METNLNLQANERNSLLEHDISTLQQEKDRLIEAMQILTTEQNNLKKNISSLYLTAKTEIDRKNRVINELRMELEDLKFRRVGKRKWHPTSEEQRPAKVSKTEPPKEQQCSNKCSESKEKILLENANDIPIEAVINIQQTEKYINVERLVFDIVLL